jgi:hypothetical protein
MKPTELKINAAYVKAPNGSPHEFSYRALVTCGEFIVADVYPCGRGGRFAWSFYTEEYATPLRDGFSDTLADALLAVRELAETFHNHLPT